MITLVSLVALLALVDQATPPRHHTTSSPLMPTSPMGQVLNLTLLVTGKVTLEVSLVTI